MNIRTALLIVLLCKPPAHAVDVLPDVLEIKKLKYVCVCVNIPKLENIK